tara:strand:+ start:8508 stop:9341 length:834 start_codon:yes stop_codon:yes gene_type:complete
MCNTCGCKNAEETNIQLAEAFWESDSFKDWADEEVREHGDVSFGDWADQEFREASHKGSDPLLFEDWARHEESEMAHQAESFEADGCGCGDEMVMEAESFEGETEVFCANCGGRRRYDSETPTDEEMDWERMADKARMRVDKSRKGITQRKALRQYLQRRKDAEFELHDWYDPMSDYGMMNTNPVIQEQRDEFVEEMDNQRDSYNKAKKQEMAIERRMRNINRAVRNERVDATSPLSRRMPITAGAKSSAGGMVPNYIKYGLGALVVYAGYKVASNK